MWLEDLRQIGSLDRYPPGDELSGLIHRFWATSDNLPDGGHASPADVDAASVAGQPDLVQAMTTPGEPAQLSTYSGAQLVGTTRTAPVDADVAMCA